MYLEEIRAKPLSREARDHADQVPGRRDPDVLGQKGTIIEEAAKVP
jgi:hypothetical protein